MDVVFVCTGNICRSPMAEAILRAHLADRAPEVVVGSVGLRFDGRPAEPHAVKTMAKRGYDLEGFQSRIVSAELLAGSSLVLGMERLHVREVSVLGAGLFDRTFTLPEFVAAARAAGPRRAGNLLEWTTSIGGDRSPLASLGVRRDAMEVPDPIGRSGRAFRACADQLESLIDQLVDLAWPRPAAAPTTAPTLLPPVHGGP